MVDHRIGPATRPASSRRRRSSSRQANVSGMDAVPTRCAPRPSATSRVSGRASRARTSLWHKPFTQVLDESNAPFYKWFEDGELNASYNCLDRNLDDGNADKVAIIFEADDGKVTQDHLPASCYHDASASSPTALKSLGIKKGDRVHHLHADVDRGGGRDAGVRAHRRHALGRVRRLLRQEPAGAHHRRRRDRGDHRRRADARRQGARRSSRSSTRRSRMGGCEAIKNVVVYQRTGGKVPMEARSRRVVARRCRRTSPTTCEPACGRRRASAVHPLHVGLDRQAEGRAALDRRLPAVGRPDDEVDVRHTSRPMSSGARPTSAG